MLAQLREEVVTRLARHQFCLLSTSGMNGMWAIPVRCQSLGLEVDCLVPKWSDPAHYLTENPNLLLLFCDLANPSSSWLQYQGRGELISKPDGRWLPASQISHPESLFIVVRARPDRIDVVDEARGWGVIESIDTRERKRS